MTRKFGYWRDSVIRKHNWNKKRPFYESLVKSLEPPKKRRKRTKRVLKNGQWVRKAKMTKERITELEMEEYHHVVILTNGDNPTQINSTEAPLKEGER